MRRVWKRVLGISFGCLLLGMGVMLAQRLRGQELNSLGRGGQDWTTSGADAQRTSWIKSDYAISKESMEKPGFKLLWRLHLDNQSSQLNSLMPPVTAGMVGGTLGFKFLAFVSGSSNDVTALNYDLGRVFWNRQLGSTVMEQPSTLACPGGITSGTTLPTPLTVTAGPIFGGRGFPGRGVGFRSGVGQPGQGAPDIFGLGGQPVQFGGRGPARGGRGGAAGGRGGRGRGFRRAQNTYVITGDGMLHSLSMSTDGLDVAKPRQFLPANSWTSGFILVNDVAYAATTSPCGGAPNALWAMDLSSPNAKPKSWDSNGGPIAGTSGPAFGPDGTIYVAIGSGQTSASGYSDAVVALDPGTLKVKDWFTEANAAFTSSPVVLKYKDREIVAASTKDGRIFLLDSKSLGGTSHKTPLFASPAYSSTATDFQPMEMASWVDGGGTAWLLEPVAGPLPANLKLPENNGKVTNGGIVALKVVEANGKLVLQPGWISRDLISPLPPIIVNGVVFAASSGEYHPSNANMNAHARITRSVPAVLYALDGSTGKELWNSGPGIGSFIHSGTLAESQGQVYLSTYGGWFYAFGMPAERE